MISEYLPGLSYLDIRQLDHEVSRSDVINASIGFILGTIAMTPGPLVRKTFEVMFGSTFAGLVAEALYKVVVVYVAILILAHSTTTEDSAAN